MPSYRILSIMLANPDCAKEKSGVPQNGNRLPSCD